MKHLGQPKGDTSNKNLIVMIVGPIAILIVVIAAYLVVDFPYRQRFEAVYKEVEEVRQDAIEPKGGIERVDDDFPHFVGDEFFRFAGCGPDVNCPEVSREWFIAIEPGKDDELRKDVAENAGYSNFDGLIAHKGEWDMMLNTHDLNGVHPPSAAPGGKVWKLLQVRIYGQ